MTQYYELKKVALPDWYPAKQGLPPNKKETTDVEFWHLLNNFSPLAIAWTSWVDDFGKYQIARLFFYSGKQGVGYIKRVEQGSSRSPTEYFWFGACDHETAEMLVGNCIYEHKCKKCGYTYRVDSSD